MDRMLKNTIVIFVFLMVNEQISSVYLLVVDHNSNRIGFSSVLCCLEDSSLHPHTKSKVLIISFFVHPNTGCR